MTKQPNAEFIERCRAEIETLKQVQEKPDGSVLPRVAMLVNMHLPAALDRLEAAEKKIDRAVVDLCYRAETSDDDELAEFLWGVAEKLEEEPDHG